jgi:hypothetical protein
MLSMLKDYKGSIEINGEKYDSVKTALKRFKSDSDTITIKLSSNRTESVKSSVRASETHTQKKITVKQYMTRKATDDFDFMKTWNNDNPMPLRTMIGTVEKETRGMVYMKLHADITEEKTQRCLCCGRPITNPVSQYFGMGPECGGHNYINPFYSKEELENAVKDYRENVLRNITWEGWIIKSAIVFEEEINI